MTATITLNRIARAMAARTWFRGVLLVVLLAGTMNLLAADAKPNAPSTR